MNELTLQYRLNIYCNDRDVYIESQKFINGVFSEAKPLTKKAFRQILSLSRDDVYRKYKMTSQLLDPAIISFNERIANYHVMWFRPADEKRILVTGREYDDPYIINMPSLVYFYNGIDLQVFALEKQSRPRLDSKLFYPPLKNQVKDCKFCWGSVWKKDEQVQHPNDVIRTWEANLWGSYFNNDGPENVKSGSVYALFEKLHKSGRKFPVKELIPYNKTVSQILNDQL